PNGLTFIKYVDALDVVKDASTLFHLFSEVVEWVGPSNAVHVVTDNATNYIAAGRLLHAKYDSIYWFPCVAHCLNLLLKDIVRMPRMDNLVSHASQIILFLKRSGWIEIVRFVMTRFPTSFITLKSIYDHKHDLQALVTSKHFTIHKLANTSKGKKKICSTILDMKFWDDYLIAIKVASPIIRLLRIIDSYEKPSLGYVYDGMFRAKIAIKFLVNNKKRWYKP
ncbi:DUF659 domain-containing protein, partial [Cephalotus follicularis]